jgi:hypothetical protein
MFDHFCWYIIFFENLLPALFVKFFGLLTRQCYCQLPIPSTSFYQTNHLKEQAQENEQESGTPMRRIMSGNQ